jgi:hypothetical protein
LFCLYVNQLTAKAGGFFLCACLALSSDAISQRVEHQDATEKQDGEN